MQKIVFVNPSFVVAVVVIILLLLVVSAIFLTYQYDNRMTLWGTGWLIITLLAGPSIVYPSISVDLLDAAALLGITLGSTLMLNGCVRPSRRFPLWAYGLTLIGVLVYDAVVFLAQVLTRIAYILPEFYAGVVALLLLRGLWNHYQDHSFFWWFITVGTLGWTLTTLGVSLLLVAPESWILPYLDIQAVSLSMVGLGIFGWSVVLSHKNLEQQNNLAILLASVIHHDIRNYIQLILQALELAQTKGGNDREWIETATEVTRSVSAFLEEVREVTSEIARYRRSEKVIDLTSVIHSVGQLIGRVYEDTRLQIIFDLDEPLMVYSNELVHQIIYNIIDNAIKHGSTFLEITGKDASKHVTLTITDRAGGLPQSLIDFINEPGDLSRAPGIGLGMILIKGLAPLC